MGALLGAADDNFAAFIGLCAFGGLRLGEAAALKASDVDFIRQEIRVDRQVQRANGKRVEIRSPKYGSNRTIYAPDGLIKLLSEHVRVQVPGDDPDRLLFPGKANTQCIRSRLVTSGARPGQRLASTTGCTT